MAESAENGITLNRSTLVPVGVAIAVALGLCSGSWWAATQLTMMNARLERIEYSMAQQWTLQDQIVFQAALSEANRDIGLKVPQVQKAPGSHLPK
jgi:hypothetical protein